MSDDNRQYGDSGRPRDPQWGQEGHGPYGEQQPQYGQYGDQGYPQQVPGQPGYGQPPYGEQAYGQPQYGQYGPPQDGAQYPQDQQGVWQAPTYQQGTVPPWQAQYGAMPGQPRVPSVWARLGARVIDALIVGIPLAIIGSITGWDQLSTSSSSFRYNAGNGIYNVVRDLIMAAYCAYFYMAKGATPGKMALRLQVVDERNGQRLSFGRGFLREIVLSVTGLLCLLGYFSIFFDGTGRKRGWHDKAAQSWVIGA